MGFFNYFYESFHLSKIQYPEAVRKGNAMSVLHGMTWDHPRGCASVRAVSEEFARLGGARIQWTARSLKDFEDFPVETLAKQYDLMMIDHPHIGAAVRAGALEAMDGWLDPDFLLDQKRNSVGPGYATYAWAGRQWALSVDEAAQVCAWRPDALDAPLPQSWDAVLRLAGSLPKTRCMVLPLAPTHAFSSFITLNANIGGPDFWQGETRLRRESALEAFSVLERLAAAADPRSFAMDPILALDAMTAQKGDPDIVYIPLIYGYSNYARQGYRARVARFGDMPSATDQPRGSMIGGVGIAVSARSAHKREAMAFARHLASAECQRGTLYFSGGQPGYLQAWRDRAVNADCGDFFLNTLRTLELSYVRPRRPGYCAFQQRAGELIRAALLNKTSGAELVDDFNRLFTELVPAGNEPNDGLP